MADSLLAGRNYRVWLPETLRSGQPAGGPTSGSQGFLPFARQLKNEDPLPGMFRIVHGTVHSSIFLYFTCFSRGSQMEFGVS